MQYACNVFVHAVFSYCVAPKYTNFATFSKVLLSACVAPFKELHMHMQMHTGKHR
jgi:hypothetical protein